jgi:hypothetical protein
MDTSQIKEHMDVISSDRKTVGKVDHMDGQEVTTQWQHEKTA